MKKKLYPKYYYDKYYTEYFSLRETYFMLYFHNELVGFEQHDLRENCGNKFVHISHANKWEYSENGWDWFHVASVPESKINSYDINSIIEHGQGIFETVVERGHIFFVESASALEYNQDYAAWTPQRYKDHDTKVLMNAEKDEIYETITEFLPCENERGSP